MITILLKNALPLEELIPTGYINPTIADCTVSGLTGTIGSIEHRFAGGFIGEQVGTVVNGCSVANSNYKVQALKYGGDFVGLSREAEIEGTLSSGLGIELARKAHVQSLQRDCSIEGSALETEDSYRIYRTVPAGTTAQTSGGSLGAATSDEGTSYSYFSVSHLNPVSNLNDLKGATMTASAAANAEGGSEANAESSGGAQPLDAYASPAKAVLMADAV